MSQEVVQAVAIGFMAGALFFVALDALIGWLERREMDRMGGDQ